MKNAHFMFLFKVIHFVAAARYTLADDLMAFNLIRLYFVRK